MTKKCKTCGRAMSYGYGGATVWGHSEATEVSHYFSQKVGVQSKTKWIKAIEQSPFELEPNAIDKKKEIDFLLRTPISEGLFCRQSCLYTFIAYYNREINSMPNLLNVV